jgi:hypothetical protein
MHQCAIQLSGAKDAWDTRNTEAAADAKIMMQNISANLDAAQKKSWDLAYDKYNRNQVLKNVSPAERKPSNYYEVSEASKMGICCPKPRHRDIHIPQAEPREPPSDGRS